MNYRNRWNLYNFIDGIFKSICGAVQKSLLTGKTDDEVSGRGTSTSTDIFLFERLMVREGDYKFGITLALRTIAGCKPEEAMTLCTRKSIKISLFHLPHDPH
jgi:hypothetical protein